MEKLESNGSSPGVPSPQEDLRAVIIEAIEDWADPGDHVTARLADALLPLFAARVAAIEAAAEKTRRSLVVRLARSEDELMTLQDRTAAVQQTIDSWTWGPDAHRFARRIQKALDGRGPTIDFDPPNPYRAGEGIPAGGGG